MKHACSAVDRKEWMRAGIDAIREEPLDMAAAIATRRQTDVVQDHQGDRRIRRTGVGIGRPQPTHRIDPAVVTDDARRLQDAGVE